MVDAAVVMIADAVMNAPAVQSKLMGEKSVTLIERRLTGSRPSDRPQWRSGG
jgi:hypothetical protein